MIYAQAEDDFNRIEVNFLNAMGRLAEAEGEAAVFRDLRMKLFIDPDELRSLYDESPAWLRALMNAWADGLNYYLHTHPETRPRVITRFEPWMALSFTEGSIGGDIERISIRALESFYGVGAEEEQLVAAAPTLPPEPTGSNGFAIAPSRSASGNALLLINPHTSFYFRSELHMASDEGLNAYGAVTWGQFFVYQGFNETAGWMHTSSGVDNIDEFYYDVSARDEGVYYPYDGEERRMREKIITVPYRSGDGLEEQRFKVFFSHHGPIVRGDEGRWISTALMNEPIGALTQSYTRTKAAGYDEYREIMELHTNSSNNTVFADAEGNIAYFHSNFVPVRSVDYDWSAPVTGMRTETEWQGLHAVDDSPNALNPPEGWIQNTNNWPYSVSGASSPRQQDYAPYFDRFGENFRGLNAVRVLDGGSDFTLETLRDAAYDSYLTGFEALLPALIAAYDGAPTGGDAGDAIDVLRDWDYRWGVDSVATSVAVFWGRDVLPRVRSEARAAGVSDFEYLQTAAPPALLIASLERALERLTEDFGTWRTPWGEINRFQRISSSIEPAHDDDRESIPVAFTSARWGSLASFGANRFDTKRLYGSYGNSFVAVVEFGERVRALAVTAGGLSGDPDSPHFNDQAPRYASGDLRPVYFYREDVEANAERTYRPGLPN